MKTNTDTGYNVCERPEDALTLADKIAIKVSVVAATVVFGIQFIAMIGGGYGF